MARIKIDRNIYLDEKKELYYVTFYYGKDKDTDKYIKKTKTFEKLKEAQKALRQHETAVDNGKVVRPKDLTLGDWLQQWMNTVVRMSKAKTTIYAYENIQRHILEELGSVPLQKLTPQQIQQYYATLVLERGLSTNTARKHHDLLNSALKVAVKQELIPKNPIEMTEAPKVEAPAIHFYNREEIAHLLECSVGTRLELLIHLAGMLGLRREEILGLSWTCVDFSKKTLEIRTVRTQAGKETVVKKPKTNSSRRTLHLPDKILSLLQVERDKQKLFTNILGADYENDEGYVIVWDDGSPMRPNYASDLFQKFIKDNNLPHITLHGLRHSFATIASDSGLPLYDIGRALGHSNTSTTSKIYTHLLDQDHKVMMERMWGEEKDR